MKKQCKGFTLTELLAVIIILGLLILIIVPVVDHANTRAKNELYLIQRDNIIKGAKNWAAKNFAILPEEEGEMLTLTIGQLKQSDFVDKNITDPRTKKKFPNDMEVTITRENNSYSYDLLEDTGTDSGGEFEAMPMIYLIGSIHEKVEINSEYLEKGVEAFYSNGSKAEYETLIEHNGIPKQFVDTSKFIQYKIKYTVREGNKTASIIRTVTIEDTIPPTLIIPSDKTITISEVANFNKEEGVTVSDNSEEEIEVQITGEISSEVGEYILTYEAVDSSGNKTSKIRKINVIN